MTMDMTEVRKLFVEPTTACNARCLTCSATRNRKQIRNDSLTPRQIEDIVSEKRIDRLLMSGKSGEPTLADGFIEMIEASAEHVDRIKVATNGATRDDTWWSDLASVMRTTDAVTFGIDGLEGTHELNRAGTSFGRIMENARAFIESGGNAIWQYIMFAENERDVDEALSRAIDMGFSAFFTRSSYKYAAGLTRPSGAETQEERSTSGEIVCSHCDGGEAYVSGAGIIYPCPRLAPMPGKPGREAFFSEEAAKLADRSFFSCSLSHGATLESALSSPIFEHVRSLRHETDPCTRLCRAGATSTNFKFLHGRDWE